MRIFLDAMGGDNAPQATVAGAIEALRRFPELELTLAGVVDQIQPLLTEAEHDVFRRGRNANVHTVPHSADRATYQTATALEALFGWLYLRGEKERINELFSVMMEGYDVT